MMQIPKEELLDSLKEGYLEVKRCLENGTDKEDLAHVKGFCVTIEQILSAYGGITKDEMLAIKTPIIGNISLRRKKDQEKKFHIDDGADYDRPTIFRKKERK